MPPLKPDNDSMDRYQILERIAGGGMGRIYRGVKKGIGGFQKPVVLKQLLPELTKDPELVDLFSARPRSTPHWTTPISFTSSTWYPQETTTTSSWSTSGAPTCTGSSSD